MRELNRLAYLKRVGHLKRRSTLEMTDELRKQYYRDKANNRATRAKRANLAVIPKGDNLRKGNYHPVHD
jgi:chorismate mutase